MVDDLYSKQALPESSSRDAIGGLITLLEGTILENIIFESNNNSVNNKLILPSDTNNLINIIIRENRQIKKYRRNHLPVKKRLLFQGLAGTGKSMTAQYIARYLEFKKYNIFSNMLTTKNIPVLFNFIKENPAVYEFDDFPELFNDKKLFYAFITALNTDLGNSVIIQCIMGQITIPYRFTSKFDEMIQFRYLSDQQNRTLIRESLGKYYNSQLKNIYMEFSGYSPNLIVLICQEAKKQALLSNSKITERKMKDIMIQKSKYFN